MRVRRALAVFCAAAALSALGDGCANVLGIDGEYGDLVDGGGTPPLPDVKDEPRDAANDGDARDARDTGVVDVVSDVHVPCATPSGACVAALPADWELVLFERDRGQGCPVDFAGSDLIANPTAQPGACDCSCTLGQNPSCDRGRLSTAYSQGSNSCATNGAALNVNGSACTSLTSSLSDYFSGTPLAATVTCSASTVANDTLVDSTPMRECAVPSACREEICNGDVPDGFSACVARDGTFDCPAGWSAKTVVGDDANVACSSCTCTAMADCMGARISFFSNNGCTTGEKSFDVNGVCQDTNGGGSIRGFTYTANVANARCTADGPKTATVTLVGTRTICCK